jgi:hypothetical protein
LADLRWQWDLVGADNAVDYCCVLNVLIVEGFCHRLLKAG